MKIKSKKPLHLIIDGADKTGKSTVCKLLSKKLGLPIIKMKDMPLHIKSDPEEASEIFNKTVQQFKDFSFILDRGYPTSLVYSTYFDRDYDFSYLHEFQKEMKPTIVILTTKSRTKDDIWDDTELSDINELYQEYAKADKWNLIDVTGLTPSETCKEILKIIA